MEDHKTKFSERYLEEMEATSEGFSFEDVIDEENLSDCNDEGSNNSSFNKGENNFTEVFNVEIKNININKNKDGKF